MQPGQAGMPVLLWRSRQESNPHLFQLRLTPLEAETDTRAKKFRIANLGFRIATQGSQNPHSEFQIPKFFAWLKRWDSNPRRSA